MALVGVFSVIVQCTTSPINRLLYSTNQDLALPGHTGDTGPRGGAGGVAGTGGRLLPPASTPSLMDLTGVEVTNLEA